MSHDDDDLYCPWCAGMAAGRQLAEIASTEEQYLAGYRKGVGDRREKYDVGPDQVISASGEIWPADRYPEPPIEIGQPVTHSNRGAAVFCGRDDWDPDTSYVLFPDEHQPARVTHTQLTPA